MHGPSLNLADERRSVRDRRVGFDRRSGMERRFGTALRARSRSADEGQLLDPGSIPLRRLFPHAQFDEREASTRAVAIAAHHQELSARLGRDVGHSVAALDYQVNISRELVSPAIVEQQVLEVLQHRSVTDPLTGLFNRYHFEATLKREVARCLRHRTHLSLLLLDVDQLKAVNDRWGHQAGDRVLGQVAQAIQRSLREADTGSRYGGDEFAVILPDTPSQAGRLVAERILANVAASLEDGVVPEASATGTVSGGLAELPLAATAVSDTELIVAADRALYLAKSRGGNRIVEEVPPCRD